MASHQRVLMVGEESVILYAPADQGIGRAASIAWGAPDFEQQMARALGESRMDDAVVVLFNEGDHTYRKEVNILPSDRLARLERLLPDYPLRASMEIALAEAEPDKTSYLFVGLPESAHLKSLGRALHVAHAPVAGFGLLPVESAGLVEELAGKIFREGRKSRWAMLSGQHETGGLRQVIIKDGQLALTRLVPVPGAHDIGAAAWAEASTRELKQTMAYVARFGFTEKEGMDIMVVCDESHKRLFDPQAIPGAALRCLTQTEALRHLGCRVDAQELNGFADALHAAWTERAKALKLSVPIPLTGGESQSRH